MSILSRKTNKGISSAAQGFAIVLSVGTSLLAVGPMTFTQYGAPPMGAGPSPMQELARQAAIDKIEAVENGVEQNPSRFNDPRYLAHIRTLQSSFPCRCRRL